MVDFCKLHNNKNSFYFHRSFIQAFTVIEQAIASGWLREAVEESTSVMSSLSTPTSLLSQSEADITFDLKPPVSVNSSQFFFLCYWMRLFGAYCEMFKIPQHQCHHRCKYVLMTDLTLDLILLWLLSCRCVCRRICWCWSFQRLHLVRIKPMSIKVCKITSE